MKPALQKKKNDGQKRRDEGEQEVREKCLREWRADQNCDWLKRSTALCV